jgi:serine phosphatase RsbU (regulator of sigma subunit)
LGAPARTSPLIRTVDRILRVIPSWVDIVLAALAAAGLLVGAAALRQTRRARRLERDRRRLAADVGLLQSALLPVLPPAIGGARVTAAYRPAAGLAAGGDFFDVFALADGRTALILGDMAGHGREIVPFTALVRYSLRAYLEAGLAPRVALQVAATVLEAQLGGHMVTAVVAVFDADAGLLTYSCAGHPPPLLGHGVPPVTATSSPPIAAGVATGRRQTTVELPAGSSACFYTDGVADVRVGDGRLGSEDLAAQLKALGSRASADDLLRSVVRNSDAQPDDMAVCVLAPLAGNPGSRHDVVEELELDAEMLSDGRVARFLADCTVSEAAASEATRAAAEMVSQKDGAVLVVRRGEAVSVRVVRPRTAVLPVARQVARPPAAATQVTAAG